MQNVLSQNLLLAVTFGVIKGSTLFAFILERRYVK